MRRITEGQYALGALTVFTVWIFVVLPLLYYPRQEPPENPKRSSESSESQQQASNISNKPPTFTTLKLFTATGRDEIAAYCATKPKEEKNEWAHNYICDIKVTDTYLTLFNFLLVIVTGGLILVGFLTIRKMRITEERQLRAYVFVENVFWKIGSGKIQDTVKIKNFGSTPAHKVTLLLASQEIDWNGGKYTIPSLNNVGLENLGSMAPNGDFYESEGAAIHVNFNALHTGTRVIYVVGKISYTTVFRKTETTNFHYYIGGDVPLPLGTVDGEMSAAAEGNDAT